MQVVEAPVGRVGGYPRLEPALVVPEPPAVGSVAPVVVARVGSALDARVVRYSGKGILRFNCKIFKFNIYSIFLHGVFYSSSSPNCRSVKKSGLFSTEIQNLTTAVDVSQTPKRSNGLIPFTSAQHFLS